MIILEGGDGVGKTTAANTLVQMTNTKVVHAGVKAEGYDFIGQRMAELRPGYIHDRFHLSAFVYGFLLKCHPTNLTRRSMLGLMRWIRWNSVVTVILFDSHHVELERRLRERGDDHFKLSTCLAANQMYEFLVHQDVDGEPFCDTAWDVATMGWPTKEGMQGWLKIDSMLHLPI